MANPIIECIQATGMTIYRVAKNRLTGQTGNQNTSAWETFNAAHWAQYAVALTEDTGTGYYHAGRPAWEAGSLVTDIFYTQAGGSPATSDAPPFNLLHGEGENIAAINADPVAAPKNLQAALSTETQAAVASGTITNTSFPTTLPGESDNLYVGRLLLFTSGANFGSAVSILAYSADALVVTVSPLVSAPAVSDTFIIV